MKRPNFEKNVTFELNLNEIETWMSKRKDGNSEKYMLSFWKFWGGEKIRIAYSNQKG
jgi:hypothetical protein